MLRYQATVPEDSPHYITMTVKMTRRINQYLGQRATEDSVTLDERSSRMFLSSVCPNEDRMRRPGASTRRVEHLGCQVLVPVPCRWWIRGFYENLVLHSIDSEPPRYSSLDSTTANPII